VEDVLKNKLGLEVLTDMGWSKFDALHVKGVEKTVTIKTDKATIICTPTHKFYTKKLHKIEASTIKPCTKLYGRTGIHSVVSIAVNEELYVYDLINVAKNNRFYANDILVSNCEFIIYDETLINPIVLTELLGVDPAQKQGQVRWYKEPQKGHVYLVGLDPSLGTGGDPAAIQVLELPNMIQIAEWQHNRTPIQQQVKIMSEITKYLVEKTDSVTDVYYSVENNNIGEAALITISEFGEENIKGTFLSEPKRAGQSRAYRKGFNTTHKSKLAACAKFKNLLETKKLQINSKSLVSELKTFVAANLSYAAKPGETDDLVMAMLLVIRMAVFLREFDSTLDEKLKDSSDEIVMPMPFIMMS